MYQMVYLNTSDEKKIEALVYPDGEVLWIPPTNMKTFCDFDWTNWPWDVQNCSIIQVDY